MNSKKRSSLTGILIILLLTSCSSLQNNSTPYTILLITSTMTATTPVSFSVKTPSPFPPSSTVLPTSSPMPSTETITPSPTITSTPLLHVTDFPDTNGFIWQPVMGGLSEPITLVSAGDGSGRVFILEKAGRVIFYKEGAEPAQIFLDIQGRVGSTGSEQGLLGIAFSPQYAQDGAFYLDYTDLNGNTVIARYHVSANADQADPSSDEMLLQIQQPYANHNGGQLAFGPDGYLYIGMGDGGSGGDPYGNGQSLTTLLGKILRVDVSLGQGYKIPPDNPFRDGSGLPEIWAYGLRNPWRFSFDRLNGDLYIGDVGQNKWEEVDFLTGGSPGGENFGWNYREGLHAYSGNLAAGIQFTDPIFEYGHNQGCSITGGYVYRGSSLQDWQGVYFFGDYCQGTIWGLLPTDGGQWKSQILFSPGFKISSFGQDDAGELYVLNYSAGQLLKLVRR